MSCMRFAMTKSAQAFFFDSSLAAREIKSCRTLAVKPKSQDILH